MNSCSVPSFNCLSLGFWKPCVHFIDGFRVRNHLFDDGINQLKKTQRSIPIIFQIDDSGMHSLVSDNPDNIQRLLNQWVQSLFDQTAYVVIDVLALLSKMAAQLLDTEAQQSRSPARRSIDDL